jgi:heat shock protein HspQ
MPRQQQFSYNVVWENEDGGVQAFLTCNQDLYDAKQEELRGKGIDFRTNMEARREKAG